MCALKIDLVAPPFHGHLHPLLGLGVALRDVADVRVLTTPNAAARVEAAGFNTRAILSAHEADVWSIANTKGPVRGRPWMLWRQFRQNLLLLPLLREEVEAAWDERRPDVVIVDFTLPTVGHWALARGLRWWTSHPSPLAIETPDGTPAYLGGWKPPTHALTRLRDAVGRRCVRFFKRTLFAAYGRTLRGVGLPRLYRDDGSEEAYSPEAVLALAWQPHEFPCTWPKAVRFLGPSLYTPPHAHREPETAPQLDPARQNVLVTIGTHLPYARERMASTVQRWAEALPHVCLHYTTGGIEISSAREGTNWRTYRYIDYEQYLGRFDAVVHHGGAGITHHTLRAGLPAVVWPQDYDQFDFAARLEHHGLARWCRRAKDVPAALAKALAETTPNTARSAAADAVRATDLQRDLMALLIEKGLLPAKV